MKMLKKFAATLALVSCAATVAASAAELNIEIKGIGSDKGTVYVAVYDKAASWLKKDVYAMKTAAKKGSVTFTLKGIAEGDYAISMYHDENDNGKMDSNVVGMPIEPYAFSNDAAGNFGPASFEQAKFKVEGDKKSIVINIK